MHHRSPHRPPAWGHYDFQSETIYVPPIITQLLLRDINLSCSLIDLASQAPKRLNEINVLKTTHQPLPTKPPVPE